MGTKLRRKRKTRREKIQETKNKLKREKEVGDGRSNKHDTERA